MSSHGQIIGGVVGAVAGFFIGGPSGALYGAQIGIGVGGILDPAKGPNTYGPRLTDLSVQSATYGAVIPRVYGTISVLGNIFWIENNSLKEVSNTEDQAGGKGGGSGRTSTTYSYYATFAVGLCQGPIAGINRIWIGPDLIYDAGSTNLDSIIASNSAASGFTLYLGTDIQSPDSRMQATLGVANTPAYRGLAYLVFKDLLLTRYGNSLQGAQVKVEIVTNATGTLPSFLAYTSIVTGSAYRQCYTYSDNVVSAFNCQNIALVTGTTYQHILMTPDLNSQTIKTITMSLPFTGIPQIKSVFFDGLDYYAVLAVGNLTHCVLTKNGVFCAYLLLRPIDTVNWDADELGLQPSVSGLIWWTKNHLYMGITKRTAGNYNLLCRWSINATGSAYADTVVTSIDETPGGNFRMCIKDNFINILTTAKTLKTFDLNLNLISSVSLASMSVSSSITSICIDGDYIFVGTQHDIQKYSLLTLANIGVYTTATFLTGWPSRIFVVGGLVYYQIEHSLYVLGFPIITAQSVPLSSIVSAESLSSKSLSAGDIDVTALTQTVRGFKVANIAAIRASIEPLRSAFQFDAIQSGYKIKFKPRGSASVATINASELAAIKG